MDLKTAIRYVQEFKKIGYQNFPFQYTISNVWHFNHSRGKGVPFGDANGIYIYTIPCSKAWNYPPGEVEENVLYIGKSNGDIGGRVWQHVGLIYEPNTKIECNPRFKYNQWSEDLKVPEDIRKRLSRGDISVVTIKVDLPNDSLIPEAIEKYLLSICVRLDGKLPVLNKEI